MLVVYFGPAVYAGFPYVVIDKAYPFLIVVHNVVAFHIRVRTVRLLPGQDGAAFFIGQHFCEQARRFGRVPSLLARVRNKHAIQRISVLYAEACWIFDTAAVPMREH